MIAIQRIVAYLTQYIDGDVLYRPLQTTWHTCNININDNNNKNVTHSAHLHNDTNNNNNNNNE